MSQRVETGLQSNAPPRIVCAMGLPTEPVTLSVAQIEQMNVKFGKLRHDVNNHLSLIVAASELIRYNPDMLKRMSVTLTEQPPKISDELARFSVELDKLLGITRS